MTSLKDLLSVDLVLLHLTPQLPVSSLLKLAATCRDIRDIIYQTPGSFRYLDLSTRAGATSVVAPIDRGGFNWRAERMDENLTEDDFYGGPLRGIFSKFIRRNVLRDVQTLVLDRQAVTHDIVLDIITGDDFRVKILSLLEAQALNMGKLRQAIAFACRDSRPVGTPRLQGLYLFSEVASYDLPGVILPNEQRTGGVTVSTGAQLGAQINQKSRSELFGREPHPAYRAAGGRAMLNRASGWEGTLNKCNNIIAFDATLCRGPRHDPLTSTSPAAIASVCLGSQGCEQCGKMPEGFAIAGQSPLSEVPMLRPPPMYGSTARLAQTIPHSGNPEQNVPFVARCRDCVKERWCEGCNRFWCEECYRPAPSGTIPIPAPVEPDQPSAAVNSHIKVFMGYCVERCLVSELYSGAGEGGMWG